MATFDPPVTCSACRHPIRTGEIVNGRPYGPKCAQSATASTDPVWFESSVGHPAVGLHRQPGDSGDKMSAFGVRR